MSDLAGRTGQRVIHLAIAPATATTCGDGSGAFCPLTRASNFGSRFSCALWGALEDEGGWLQRRAECLASERLKTGVHHCDRSGQDLLGGEP